MNGQAEHGAGDLIVRTVTVIMASVVGLTFLFGFGNVLSLGLRLGVPVWVAPLVAPAVDLSILGLLLGIRHLALAGATPEVLRPARRLLMFASAVTLALNVAEPVVAGDYGKAAFDAVGPLLLIGWAEVGPTFLQSIITAEVREAAPVSRDVSTSLSRVQTGEIPEVGSRVGSSEPESTASRGRSREVLLDEAREEDAAHRVVHQKPISAETLRVRLGIGSTTARQLVKTVRAEFEANCPPDTVDSGRTDLRDVEPILVA